MITLNNSSMESKIMYFMYLTNTYGKPTHEYMSDFVNCFGNSLKTGAYKDKLARKDVKKDTLDKLWNAICVEVSDAHKDGGYEWYAKIAELDYAGKTDEQIIEALNQVYVVPVEEKQKFTVADMQANWIHKMIEEELNPKVKEAEHADTASDANKTKDAENSANAANAENAENAAVADKASGLTEDGKENIFEFITKRQEKERKIRHKDLTYSPADLGSYLQSSLAYNERKLEEAISKINENHTLYIIGNTNSGKTYMCKEIAARLCNLNYKSINDGICKGSNLLMVSASIGKSEFIGTTDENGIFPRFCEYNKNSDLCLLIINEAEKNAVENILNPIWEQLKNFKSALESGIIINLPTGIQVKLPSNLYIIANVATSQYDDQMNSRFGPVIDLDDFNESDIESLYNVTRLPRNLVAEIIKLNIESRNQSVVSVNKYRHLKGVLSVYDLIKNTKEELYKLASESELLFGEEWEKLANDLRQFAEEM